MDRHKSNRYTDGTCSKCGNAMRRYLGVNHPVCFDCKAEAKREAYRRTVHMDTSREVSTLKTTTDKSNG